MRFLVAFALVAAAGMPPVAAQQQPSGPMDTYKAYLEVLAKAESLEQLLPYYTKELRDGLSKMPKEMQGNYLKMNQRALADLKVTKESVTATRAEYQMTAVTADKKHTVGRAILVKEGDTWKIDEDAWSTSHGH
jgi:hypothetical protein